MNYKGIRSLFPIKYFITMWSMIGIVLLVLPIHSIVCDSLNAFFLCVAFMILVVISATLWYWKTPKLSLKRESIKKQTRLMPRKKMKFIIRISGISTLMGNLFVLYDRIFVRGIDYSMGFRNARYQWTLSTISGSAFSKIGTLMIPLSYCCLFLGVFHWETLNKKERLFALLAGFGGQVSLAVINGGRSNILTAMVFALCVCIIRKYQGKKFFPPIKGKIIALIPIGMLLFNYIESLFYAFSENSLRQLYLYLSILGVEPDEGYKGVPFLNTVIEMILYLFHGIYYSGAVVEFNPGLVNITDINHNYTFRSIFATLSGFYNYDMTLAPFDRGSSFIAVPGIFLYDYGYVGFLFMTIILGIMFGEVMKHLNTKVRNLSNGEVTVCIIVLMHIFMSPITMASGIGYFLFMIFGMIVMEFVASRFFGSSGWTLVESNSK